MLRVKGRKERFVPISSSSRKIWFMFEHKYRKELLKEKNTQGVIYKQKWKTIDKSYG